MKTKKIYHYTGSGLDDIFLLNGYEVDEEGNLFIKDIHGLHKAIARSLVLRKSKLRGKEIRFLRHTLDWSQKSLGERIGVDYQTVLRWEKGERRITKAPELLLRAIAYEYISGDDRFVDIIDRLADIDNDRMKAEEFNFGLNRSGWHSQAA
jgi:putative transcriptional regulator